MKVDYSQRIFGLDVMRAAAILFVVCSHALWVFPEEEIAYSSLLRFAGFIGVEIFFVLSGFLIGRIMLRVFSDENYHPLKLGYFLVRRWFRTLPNYYLILLINIAIAVHLGQQLPDTLYAYFLFLQNFQTGMDNFFMESWSLPIEEFAYILGPVALYFATLPKGKVPRHKRFLWVTLFILAFFLFSKVFYHLKMQATSMDFWNIQLKGVTLYRIDSIYYGVLAAYLATRFPKLWKSCRQPLFFFGFMAFALMHWSIAKFDWNSESMPFLFNVLYFPLCSLLIATSLPYFSEWRQAPNVIQKPITFVSLISYSMYLLHYSIILQLMRYELNIDPNSLSYKWVYSLGYLGITMLLSFLLFKYYEQPMMNIRDRAFFRKRLNK